MNCITETIIDEIINDSIDISFDETVKSIKHHILDYYASCAAGYIANSSFNNIQKQLLFEIGGKEEASVLFSNKKLPACNAAFMNAIYAHGADLDDGNSSSAGHIAASVISSVFALAETRKFTWYEVFNSINAGYDTFNWIGTLSQPYLYKKGFHSTGVVGGIASAIACSTLLSNKREHLYNAMSLAALQASGLIIIDESGQACKPINPANASKTGVICALLAAKGVSAPQNPLESSKGWFNGFSVIPTEELITTVIKEKNTVKSGYMKLYPTCRHTHSCIDAATEIYGKIQSDEIIEKVEISIYPSAIKSAGNIVEPHNEEEAKFSISYATAVTLTKGSFGLENILKIEDGTAIKELERKIQIIPDEGKLGHGGFVRGCTMTVYTDKGAVYKVDVPYPKGEREKRLSEDEMAAKLRNTSEILIGSDGCRSIISDCDKIDLEAVYTPFTELYMERHL